MYSSRVVINQEGRIIPLTLFTSTIESDEIRVNRHDTTVQEKETVVVFFGE